MMDMKVFMPFAVYHRGQILRDVGGGVADIYIKRGLAEKFTQKETLETATIQRQHRSADQPLLRRGKK